MLCKQHEDGNYLAVQTHKWGRYSHTDVSINQPHTHTPMTITPVTHTHTQLINAQMEGQDRCVCFCVFVFVCWGSSCLIKAMEPHSQAVVNEFSLRVCCTQLSHVCKHTQMLGIFEQRCFLTLRSSTNTLHCQPPVPSLPWLPVSQPDVIAGFRLSSIYLTRLTVRHIKWGSVIMLKVFGGLRTHS